MNRPSVLQEQQPGQGDRARAGGRPNDHNVLTLLLLPLLLPPRRLISVHQKKEGEEVGGSYRCPNLKNSKNAHISSCW